ncbi:acyl-CoA dehydrogenase family protein [Blastococcus sp. BMG 814]|uniref:Acyl-CoA dehydrogenase family protein n=1 Tax=Blastococcus carthaginiensis TaxID=3050034 RepID=A0ABT9I8M7_9ACTN|nr:acyl-CoA dehydrogenase family protein [Blastococcus carthaginiensis]MDP5181927.1 acyl-CoA dehydrogenase family protein [Blastococcus carthaginiensis]
MNAASDLPPDAAFRAEVRDWLETELSGDFRELRGSGGPGREHEHLAERAAWERRLGAAGWIGIGWPDPRYGRALSLTQQVIFHEEYARAAAPGRLGHIGEQLLAPTVLAHGTEEQKTRFLPGIAAGEDFWCQGYSEPDAGSDLANVGTRAVLDDDRWVVTGQKIWTSLAHVADWCFVIARTEPGSQRHAGLSFLLVPMDQPDVTVRPIVQLTGTSEFNEVFFDGAVAAAGDVVGEPGNGWRVAMSLLGFERGVSTLGQQIGFARELAAITERARSNGAADDPVLADRIVSAWVDLQVMRYTALRTLDTSGGEPPAWSASVSKLLWANWHRRLGELAMAVEGPAAVVTGGLPYELTDEQRLFLFSRADTIYGGSNEVQRNVLAERTLGLPRDCA